MTSEVGAWASSASVGKAVRNCWYLGNTLSTCVCWSITSETRIAYGSLVARQGKSRRALAYHERREEWTRAICSGAGCTACLGESDCRAMNTLSILRSARLRLTACTGGRLRRVLPGPFACGQREQRFAAFLPAASVGGGQIFTENPVGGIAQHMPLDALGVHDVLV